MKFEIAAAAKRLATSCAVVGTLAGCAATPLGPTVQVMPGAGKSLEAFQADTNACKTFAADQVKGQAEAANQRAVGTALLTTALGAATGGAVGSTQGQLGSGIAAGSAIGAGGGAVLGAVNNTSDQAGIQQQYDNAFSGCMYAKGDQVPGYAPVRVATAPMSSGPAPDPLIRATQTELIRLGLLPPGSADGYTGSRTRGAISTFETTNGIPADGATSPRLLDKLQATPTGGGAAPVASAPPAQWVQPVTGAPSVTPASASAAPGGWVQPTKSP